MTFSNGKGRRQGPANRKPTRPGPPRPDRRRPAPSGPSGKSASALVRPSSPAVAPPTDWSDVADWYDRLVGDEGSEYHQKVIFPGILRLLSPQAGHRILDVACGQGAMARVFAAKGAVVVGVDAAEPLVRAARERGPQEIAYRVGDARELFKILAAGETNFDVAVCVLAIQNIHPIAPVFAGVAEALRPGGRFLIVLMHPCFRGPKESHWGWDAEASVQFRRVDRYLVPRKEPIVTHPGSDPGGYTWTFHKPLEAYVRALRNAGLLVDALEEWPSHKTSQPGPRAGAENRAREEIPLFMAIRAVRITPAG